MTSLENPISFLRAEDFRSEQLANYYVPFGSDESIVKRIIDGSQILLVGSRGTGKTMLLRMAEIRLLEQFSDRKILPLFVSFNQSRLIDASYIRQWMLAKVLYHLQRKLLKMGALSSASPLIHEYMGINVREDQSESKLTQFIRLLEDSWKKGSGLNVDSSEIKLRAATPP
jgi:Cdc6-like AAA superfamily ATPase